VSIQYFLLCHPRWPSISTSTSSSGWCMRFSEHSINFQWTFSEHSANVPWTFHEHSKNFQWTISEHPVLLALPSQVTVDIYINILLGRVHEIQWTFH
jgi:hypothetical protein